MKKYLTTILFLSFALEASFLYAASGPSKRKPASDYTWFRGNTHTHTKLSGHGDASPEEVAAWYHGHGYNFLVISEHNRFIDPEKVELPIPLRQDFILIPGLELTGKRHIHTSALNVKKVLPHDFDSPSLHKIVQNHVDLVLKAGGKPIINHPNWIYALPGQELLKVERLELMELYNGHPDVNNHGNHKHQSTEKIWDQLLSAGKKMYAVAADDAHHFHTLADHLSNPGRGWIMVKAKTLTPENIIESLGRGEFYASSGVILNDLTTHEGNYFVEIDSTATRELVERENTQGEKCDKEVDQVLVEFIGPKMEVLEQQIDCERCSFPLDKIKGNFIRAKVTICLQHAGKFRKFHAWGQPYFK